MTTRVKLSLGILGTLLLGIVILQCTDQLPSEYRPKTFPIPQEISEVCYYVSRDTVRTDTVDVQVDGADTTYVTETDTVFYSADSYAFEDIVTTGWIESRHSEVASYLEVSADSSNDYLLDSLFAAGHQAVIQLFADGIVSSLDMIPSDTTLIIHNPAGYDTSYVAFRQGSSGPAQLHWYLSWDFTANNLDDFIDVEILNAGGESIAKTPLYDPELVAGCGEHVIFEAENIDRIVPKIQTAASMELAPGEYLVRLIVSSPSQIRTIRGFVMAR